jgi:hypothetical protein
MLSVYILLGYLVGMVLCAYVLGRLRLPELTALVLIWPLIVGVLPLMLLMVWATHLGEKHR